MAEGCDISDDNFRCDLDNCLFLVEANELIFLAHLYTIATAFQGFFVFLTLIVFTKAIRDKMKTWISTKFPKSSGHLYRAHSPEQVCIMKY